MAWHDHRGATSKMSANKMQTRYEFKARILVANDVPNEAPDETGETVSVYYQPKEDIAEDRLRNIGHYLLTAHAIAKMDPTGSLNNKYSININEIEITSEKVSVS